MRQYVIIGLGIAAIGCVEGIRGLDKEGKITIISGEGRQAYCRPLISYYLQGKTDMEKMRFGPPDFYESNNCEIINAKAVCIDKAARAVALNDGRSIAYDALCAATGSIPIIPPFVGLERAKNAFRFMTLGDALSLEKALKSDTRALIVGAGLIGLKCAEGILERVKSVTVCDLAPRALSSALDEPCSIMMQRALEARGVSFMLSDTIDSLDERFAVMRSGARVEYDVLVLAVGVRPNAEIVKDIGGIVDRGIIVDTRMRSSIDDIFAAGDCAQGYDASTGENRVLAIMPNARMQGRCAGVNMAGGDLVYDNAIPMNAIGFFGLHALSAGVCAGDVYEERTDTSIKRLYTLNGRLKGFVMVGDVDKAGIYTNLIRERTPLDTVDFELIKKSPSLSAFSAIYRSKVLGGVV